MCKRAGLLIGWDEKTARALVARANCDSWDCDECKVRMREHWGFRGYLGAARFIAAGEKIDFVTITSHEKLPNFAATERVWRSAWNALYHALKRQKQDLQYMIIPEKHKDGRMHVHALWNAGVSERWLKDNARKRGLGHQVKVKRLSDQGRAQQYVVKYLGKDLNGDAPAHFRRVRVSHGWADMPRPDTELNGLTWEYIGSNGALQIVYEQCAERGIDLIDLETGAYFDDVDLGTIIYA